jgi:prepilin-type N-terminal cleavage/methylation domain-containing protein/prepilin-type processing-associated H-X9-DG protein
MCTRPRAGFRRRAFSLVELLVVIGIMAVLVAVLMPSLSTARRSAVRTQCLSNLRQMQIAQTAYAAACNHDLIAAGRGSKDVQGSWIAALEPFSGTSLARRCPADESPHFDQPIPGVTPDAFRITSYGINNYVSPTHVPAGSTAVRKITQVKNSSAVIQFVELAETASYAGADHLHVQEFAQPATPQGVMAVIEKQLAVGRHGGRRGQWDGVLNYSFLDGHAESLPVHAVYRDASQNLFIPAVAR